jgi:hypothetical protein
MPVAPAPHAGRPTASVAQIVGAGGLTPAGAKPGLFLRMPAAPLGPHLLNGGHNPLSSLKRCHYFLHPTTTSSSTQLLAVQTLTPPPSTSTLHQVEDIVDSGRTATALVAHVAAAGAASVELAALLSKPSRRAVPFEAKFTGFVIEDKFVVGYGLDFAEALRSLPYVGVLRPGLYQDSE